MKNILINMLQLGKIGIIRGKLRDILVFWQDESKVGHDEVFTPLYNDLVDAPLGTKDSKVFRGLKNSGGCPH
jgi:hypothetical protein